MKATTLLQKDHKAVLELFREYERAGGALQQKKSLFEAIKIELEIHSRIEEKLFYPAVMRSSSSKAREMVRDALGGHQIVDGLLAELSGLEPRDEEFDAKMRALYESVEEHVSEEEGRIFSQARKHISDEHLEALGDEMEAKRATLREARARGGGRPEWGRAPDAS